VSVRSAARGAANAAAQVVKRQAVDNARAQGLVSTGALVNNIAVKRERATPPNIAEYHIGVRHGKEAKGAQKIAVRGATARSASSTRTTRSTGGVGVRPLQRVPAPPRGRAPFMRPAMESERQGELSSVMRDYLAERLERTVMKALS
jgi:hypothetical protein